MLKLKTVLIFCTFSGDKPWEMLCECENKNLRSYTYHKESDFLKKFCQLAMLSAIHRKTKYLCSFDTDTITVPKAVKFQELIWNIAIIDPVSFIIRCRKVSENTDMLKIIIISKNRALIHVVHFKF